MKQANLPQFVSSFPNCISGELMELRNRNEKLLQKSVQTLNTGFKIPIFDYY